MNLIRTCCLLINCCLLVGGLAAAPSDLSRSDLLNFAITIDGSAVRVKPAGCDNRGAISNIIVNGADTYVWKNTQTGATVGMALLVTDLGAGTYQLTASNSSNGDVATSQIFKVDVTTFIPLDIAGTQTRNAVCSEPNGILRVTRFLGDSNLYQFKWIDSSSNNVIGTRTGLQSLAAGTYLLNAIDSNGCEAQIYKATILAFEKPVFDLTQIKLADDKCDLKIGGISNIKVNGLIGPSVSYSWIRADGSIAGSAKDLMNVNADEYRLTVIDGGVCLIQTPFIKISNTNIPIRPEYDSLITVPRNSMASILVKNYLDGTYRLYDDASSTQLLQTNTTGNFITRPLLTDEDFYISLQTGSCPLADPAKIKVVVVDQSSFAVPTAFTPNNDGRNDVLRVNIIGNLTLDYFNVYDRHGQLIFSTKTINDSWDGRFRGAILSTSTFVWLAKGKDPDGKVVTDKGSFTLIR